MRLRDIIAVEKPSVTRDSLGGEVGAWVELAKVWAARERHSCRRDVQQRIRSDGGAPGQ